MDKYLKDSFYLVLSVIWFLFSARLTNNDLKTTCVYIYVCVCVCTCFFYLLRPFLLFIHLFRTCSPYGDQRQVLIWRNLVLVLGVRNRAKM